VVHHGVEAGVVDEAGQHGVEADGGLDVGADGAAGAVTPVHGSVVRAGDAGNSSAALAGRKATPVHIREQSRFGGPHVIVDRVSAAGRQGLPFGPVPGAPQVAGDLSQRPEQLMRVHRHVDSLEAEPRLPTAHVGLRIHRHVARHVLLPGLEVVHDGEHARTLGVARPVQPLRVP